MKSTIVSLAVIVSCALTAAAAPAPAHAEMDSILVARGAEASRAARETANKAGPSFFKKAGTKVAQMFEENVIHDPKGEMDNEQQKKNWRNAKKIATGDIHAPVRELHHLPKGSFDISRLEKKPPSVQLPRGSSDVRSPRGSTDTRLPRGSMDTRLRDGNGSH
ncbi:hypothetical protein C8J56DRAFT_914369 [Mycena floridula]|nr:hypothetical protein C8J56DRAFT_914369 [Mycena floridula]